MCLAFTAQKIEQGRRGLLTKIEWCDETINPVKGLCKYACPYCYARRMYNRFRWDPEVRWHYGASDWNKLRKLPAGSRIFVGSTHDLMGEWIPSSWISGSIIPHCADLSQYTFIFLTKNPGRYAAFDWPANCWLGTTVTTNEDLARLDVLYDQEIEIHRGNKLFVSFEPLLQDLTNLNGWHLQVISWAIIGGLTPKPIHRQEWVDELINGLDVCGIPVFVKKNAGYAKERKEFPR
jgi:protein gp37